MKYGELLKELKDCPFCKLKKREIIFENEFGKIILARAPYHKNHILIIPNRHVNKMSELNDKEALELHRLELRGIKFISKLHKNFSILYREGDNAGKSINHLHINIIPEKTLMVRQSRIEEREFYSEEEYEKLTSKFRKKINN